jgi:predicted dehydrogenase/nucleoside-diphosphate-sugar epimerase
MAPRHRVGLVGTGSICEHHVAALRGLDLEILGVVDLDSERARQFAERFGLRALPSLAALVDEGADVVHVLTPPSAHAPVAVEALERGCHVLVEKPLAEDVEDCQRIRRVAEEKGLRACVDHSLLFDPQVERALTLARAGKLGQVVGVDVSRSSEYPPFRGGPLPPHYRQAGYPFRDLGVHALYLLQAFLGPIDDVNASWRSLGGDPNLAFDEWRALVRCRDGHGQIALSWNEKPLHSHLVVHGTRGSLRVDLFGMYQARRASTPLPKAVERLVHAMGDALAPLRDVPPNVLRFASGAIKPFQGLHGLCAAFYRALDEGGPMPVDLEEATEVVRWTEEVARAADVEHERRLSGLELSERASYLVTGASGALGSAIVDRLLQEGKRVRCMVRRLPNVPRQGVEFVVGDLGDPAAVERAVAGARLVVHAGAAMKGGWEAHECGTVHGTENVIAACLKHGVHKLVHISSMSVLHFAGGEEDSLLDERSPYEPHPEARGAYTRAKLEAERRVRDAVARDGLRAVVLRPGQIFGRRLPLFTAAVARKVGARFLVLGDGEVRLPLVYLDDVVDAVLAAAEGELSSGEVIQLVGDETPTQNELLEMVLDGEAPVVRLPRALLFWGGQLSEPLLGALGRASPVSRYRFESALAKRRFASESAARLLDWRPRVSLREGIERERSAGRLP